MFELATRKKFRFQYRGQLGVEDLWDLRLVDLDAIFKGLNREARRAEEESLLDTATEEDEVLNAKIAIVRRIVEVRLAEREERQNAEARRERKQRLLELMAEKQDDELREKSLEELQQLIDEL